MKKKKAFSIMELLIALIIISLTVSATAPILIGKIKTGKLKIKTIISSGDICKKEINNNCKICYGKEGQKKICLSCSLSCPPTSYFDKENCQCISCSERYPKDAKVCDRCDYKYCKRCLLQKGYYLDKTTTPPQHCKLCSTDFYCPDGIKIIKCPEHSTTKGERGRFQIEQCICSPGYYRTGNTCQKCGAGYYCLGDQSRRPCGPGYYCPGPTDIAPTNCGAGYYCPSATDNAPTPCGVGNYCPGPNDSSPSPCPSGSTTGTNYATNIGTCACPQNHYKQNYSPVNGLFSHCQICPDGYYCNGTYANACGLGYYCPGQGNTSPSYCPAGYYCPNSANGADIPHCTCGYYSGVGSSACTITPAGYISNESNTGISLCAGAKKYTSTAGKCSCSTCKNGTIANATHTACIETLDGCAKSKNNKCKECKSGWALMDNKKCCKKITASQKKSCKEANGYYVATDKYGCEGICVKTSNSSCNVSGVKQLSIGQSCSGKKACCWSGGTASGTVKPKVCNYFAAEECCKGKWYLPFDDELKAMIRVTKSALWKDADRNPLQLCGNSDNTTEPIYSCANATGCNGGEFSTGMNVQHNVCAAHVLWGSNAYLILSGHEGHSVIMSDGQNNKPKAPYSVRCVADMDDF